MGAQPQKSATLSPHPGGKTTKFIRTGGGIGGKKIFIETDQQFFRSYMALQLVKKLLAFYGTRKFITMFSKSPLFPCSRVIDSAPTSRFIYTPF
jgi:hypothetical protein